MKKCGIFANFIDEIGYFDMYFEWKCGYYRKRLREDFMILGGKLERLQVRLLAMRGIGGRSRAEMVRF